jgi:WD40 repeat protein
MNNIRKLNFTVALLMTITAFFTASADTLSTPLMEAGYGQLESMLSTKNGKYLITLSIPGKVYIWDITTEKVITTIAPADTDWFETIHLLPGDSTLITGTYHGTITQWRIPDGSFRNAFSLSSYNHLPIAKMAVSPDGGKIAVKKGNALRILSSDGKSLASDTIAAADFIQEMHFSPDSKKIAFREYSNYVRVYDAVTLNRIIDIYHRNPDNNNMLPFTLFDYTDDSTFLASYQTRDFHRHFGLMSAVFGDSVLDFKLPVRFNSPCGRIIPGKPLALCCDFNTKRLFIFDIKTGDTVRSFNVPEPEQILTTSADGVHALTSDINNDIFLFSIENGSLVNRLRGHSGRITSLSVSADGTAAVATNSDGSNVKVWDLTTGLLAGTLDIDSGSFFQAVFTPDGSGIVTASNTGGIALWDFASRKIVRNFSFPDSNASAVAVSPDGEEIAAGYDSVLVLWDLKTGNLKNTIPLKKAASAIHYSNDNRLVGAGSSDSIRVWEVTSKKQVWAKSTGGYKVYTLNFSPDGTRLAVSVPTSHEVTTVYSMSTEDSLTIESGYSSAWSPDGSRLLLSGFNGARLFNMNTRNFDRYYYIHRCNISASYSGAAFAKKGTRVITAIGGYIQMWENNDLTNTNHNSPLYRPLYAPRIRIGSGIARLQLGGYHTVLPLSVEVLSIAGQRIAQVKNVSCSSNNQDISILMGTRLSAGMYLYRIYEEGIMLNSGTFITLR